LLFRIVGGQPAESCHELRHASAGAVEALEIVVVPGDEEAPLAVLRGLDLAQEGLRRALHLKGVVDERVGFLAADENQANCYRHDNHQAKAHGHDDPGILHQAASFEHSRRHGRSSIWRG